MGFFLIIIIIMKRDWKKERFAQICYLHMQKDTAFRREFTVVAVTDPAAR
jgi:hypothetical protein